MFKRKLIIFITILIAACSCSDWLDMKPIDSVVDKDFYQTKEDVHAAVIGIYSSLLDKDLIDKMVKWGELRADMMTASVSAPGYVSNVIKGEMSTDMAILNWEKFYATINQCNDVLTKASAVLEIDDSFTETALKQYEAEAKTIRALMYFYLVRSFSDVPFILEASESDLQDYKVAKTEGTIILETLSKELETLINNNELPVTYYNNDSNKGRVTHWTAMTLLADMYLWQENYSKCNTLCSSLIASGQFSLIPVSRQEVEVEVGGATINVFEVSESDVNSLFDRLYVIGNSIESIFEIQFPKSHETLTDPFYTLFNPSNTKSELISNDEAVSTVIFPEYPYPGVDVYDIRGNSFSYKGINIWKWIGLARSEALIRPIQIFPHWIIYRYSDVLLMKAEALTQMAIAESEDQEKLKEAYALVKIIRDRANAVEDADSTIDENGITGKSLERLILAERAREFAFEGKRWYDVLRQAKRDNFSVTNNIYLQDVVINAAPSDKVASLLVKYKSKWFCYWPIATSAIETNPLLVQNEFYVE